MWLYLSQFEALVYASIVSVAFVLSLYIWRDSLTSDRDHPQVIQQRILSTGSVALLCFPLIWLLQSNEPNTMGDGPNLFEWMGLPPQIETYLPAIILPLLLTASLFLGPLIVIVLTACRVDHEDGTPSDRIQFSLTSLFTHLTTQFQRLWTPDESWKTIRNLIAAPIAEEVVYRATVLVLLVAGGFGFGSCVILSPILFGCAHLHHLWHLVRSRGMSLVQGTLMIAFQLTYTTLFGMYASFVYLRTGHLVSIIVAHAFCNSMGFPELRFLSPQHFLYSKRYLVLLSFVCGIGLFIWGFYPLTESRWYTGSDPRTLEVFPAIKTRSARSGPWLLHYQRGWVEPS